MCNVATGERGDGKKMEKSLGSIGKRGDVTFSKAWDVPEMEWTLWREKQRKACVIIPVINEGERIKKLLASCVKHEIQRYADIFIVDGGSQDGSLEPESLKNAHVRGLILKTGKGKLSAQLRCGYAFALRENYQYILTIDGNDKDDPVAIPQFIQKLEEGYDFVQGSRFVQGGVHENTPQWREWAIRFIHAPWLSFASGFKWTDTTQGFRGYSQRLLQSEKLQVFRSIFREYELLAYLSYKAPREGYRCIEVPCSRKYPKGVIPTKISFLRGNVQLLWVLLKACWGGFDPPRPH
jgi:dolichol-phosphate mannosyltransferase